jgi:hypothetical protein
MSSPVVPCFHLNALLPICPTSEVSNFIPASYFRQIEERHLKVYIDGVVDTMTARWHKEMENNSWFKGFFVRWEYYGLTPDWRIDADSSFSFPDSSVYQFLSLSGIKRGKGAKDVSLQRVLLAKMKARLLSIGYNCAVMPDTFSIRREKHGRWHMSAGMLVTSGDTLLGDFGRCELALSLAKNKHRTQ